MEYSIQNLSKTKIEIAISVEKEEWTKEIKKAFDKNKHKYPVDGFRRGKAPMGFVARIYGMDVLLEDALEESLSKYYSDIITENKLNVVGSPSLDVQERSEDGMKAVITVCLYPEFELGQYTGLDVKKDSEEVTDEEIDAAVAKVQADRARKIDRKDDEPVEDGDEVVIDFSGTVDGEKFEGGSAEGYDLVIGSHRFVSGFEEQIIGMKIGETKDINVTFPENYSPDLGGKAAVFTVTLHSAKKIELPVVDDEFVKDVDEKLNTVEEWRESLKAKLAADKKEAVQRKWENDIMEAICEKTEIEIPECMIEEELDYNIQELDYSMRNYGLTLADYLKYTETTVEDIRNERRADVVRNLKTKFIIDAIIKAENLRPSEEEVKAALDKMTEEEKKTQDASSIIGRLTIDKLFDFLMANNSVQ